MLVTLLVLIQIFSKRMRVGWPKCRSDPRNEGHLACLILLLKCTFSMIELSFEKYPELLNSKSKVDLVGQEFKHVTSLTFCNLIGALRPWRMDLKWYGQSPRPSLHIFIPKELNAVEGAVWYRDQVGCSISNSSVILLTNNYFQLPYYYGWIMTSRGPKEFLAIESHMIEFKVQLPFLLLKAIDI